MWKPIPSEVKEAELGFRVLGAPHFFVPLNSSSKDGAGVPQSGSLSCVGVGVEARLWQHIVECPAAAAETSAGHLTHITKRPETVQLKNDFMNPDSFHLPTPSSLHSSSLHSGDKRAAVPLSIMLSVQGGKGD